MLWSNIFNNMQQGPNGISDCSVGLNGMPGFDPNGNPVAMHSGRRVSKKEIIDYITACVNAREVVLVDEFETMRTRHICPNIDEISILNPDVFVVNLPDGSILNVGVIFCPRCGKLWINKSTLEYF